jgi:hypothetical protein
MVRLTIYKTTTPLIPWKTNWFVLKEKTGQITISAVDIAEASFSMLFNP